VSRAVPFGTVIALLSTFSADAAELSPGKYACVVQQATVIGSRNGRVVAGPLQVDTRHFIANLEPLDHVTYWCSPEPKDLKLVGEFAANLRCISGWQLTVGNKLLQQSTMYGDGRWFTDPLGSGLSSAHFYGTIQANNLEMYLSGLVGLGEGGIDQVTYRASCEPF
jgi:hypothetical protein